MQCIKGSSRGGCSLAAKNPGTEHSDVAFSSLLPPPPAAVDDGHNKNSASVPCGEGFVEVNPFARAGPKGFPSGRLRVLRIGNVTCPKCELCLDMTKVKCGWLPPAGRGIIKSLPTLILFNLLMS